MTPNNIHIHVMALCDIRLPCFESSFQIPPNYVYITELSFMFEFPCITSLYYIKNQRDATLAVLFISNYKITLHVSDAFCVHHQEY